AVLTAPGRVVTLRPIGQARVHRTGAGTTPWPKSLGALARHAVAEVDHVRAEGAGLDEFEIHPALALRKERDATANQHGVDPGPVLVDQTQSGRLGGERRAADRDGALARLGSQPR